MVVVVEGVYARVNGMDVGQRQTNKYKCATRKHVHLCTFHNLSTEGGVAGVVG